MGPLDLDASSATALLPGSRDLGGDASAQPTMLSIRRSSISSQNGGKKEKARSSHNPVLPAKQQIWTAVPPGGPDGGGW